MTLPAKSREPILITGVGVGAPHGWDFASVADGLLAGRSMVETITTFDISQHPSQIAANIAPVPMPFEERLGNIDRTAFEKLTRLDQLSLWCCVRALQDAGLWDRRENLRVGLVLGNASEWAWKWEDEALRKGLNPMCEPANEKFTLVPWLMQSLGLHGPSATISAACASGNFALSQAMNWLRMGWVDVCLAGACDTGVTPLVLGGFGNLRALSRRNEAPQAASRPFDKGRDGFVLGEGGVVFVLEKEKQAKKRGATLYGEIAGCGLSSDAHHPVIPCPEPIEATKAIQRAFADARISPADVDYINAHGTSTPVGDIAETKALQVVLGERALKVPVSSTKSMTGHLLTAASALEALACLATFQRHAIPPTINLDDPDPECNLCHVPHQAREGRVRIAISNSFGFGGSNSCAVFRAVQ